MCAKLVTETAYGKLGRLSRTFTRVSAKSAESQTRSYEVRGKIVEDDVRQTRSYERFPRTRSGS
eukprot:6031992-Pleurochrysis_carterae.AAC.1